MKASLSRACFAIAVIGAALACARPVSLVWEGRNGRVLPLAIPLGYELDLQVDPRQELFSGTAVISLQIEKPTTVVVLHGQDMSVKEVSADFGKKRLLGRAVHRPFGEPHAEMLVVIFDEELPSGPVKLTLRYDAVFSRGKLGFVRVEEGGNWYAFTNFEPSAARRVFPGFDEPAFKTPFDVTVTAPAGMLVLGNMPEVSRTATAAGTRFKFQSTPPLATYVLALAVGDFTIEEGSRDPVPIRVVRMRGKEGNARTALEAAPRLLEVLARSFAYPCPFPKIDLVAVPKFLGGAMENPGLITFSEWILLMNEEEASVYTKRRALFILAHELAHLWVGDLVTHAWWQDVMLTEGLASFMEARAIDEFRPSFGARLEQLAAIQNSMKQSGESLRAPIDSTFKAEELLFVHNDIKYDKAAAFFSMLERYVGRGTFARALRRYVRDYAWKVATFEDFVTLLEKVSGQELRAGADSFLDEKEARLVTIEQGCENGRAGGIVIRQEPYSKLPPEYEAPGQPASIAFCLSLPDPVGQVCKTLSQQTTTMTPGNGLDRCPVWIDPNPGLAGYYRSQLTSEQLDLAAAAGTRLTPEAKLGLLHDAWPSLQRGRLAPASLLRFLPSLEEEQSPDILEAMAEILWNLESSLVESETEKGFQDYVASLMKRQKKRLGLDSPWALVPWRAGPPTEDDDVVRARRIVVELLGLAGDAQVLGAAEEAAEKWLADPGVRIDPNIGDLVWRVAARRSKPALFDGMMARAGDASQGEARQVALETLSRLTDAARLRAALDLLLRPEAKSAELAGFLWRATRTAGPRRVVIDWITEHWDTIRARWDAPALEGFAALLERACSDDQREMLERLLESVKPPISISNHRSWGIACSNARKRGAESFAAFLQQKSGAAKP